MILRCGRVRATPCRGVQRAARGAVQRTHGHSSAAPSVSGGRRPISALCASSSAGACPGGAAAPSCSITTNA
jgi:hypothetical protein